jgi:hypothetical protein
MRVNFLGIRNLGSAMVTTEQHRDDDAHARGPGGNEPGPRLGKARQGKASHNNGPGLAAKSRSSRGRPSGSEAPRQSGEEATVTPEDTFEHDETNIYF